MPKLLSAPESVYHFLAGPQFSYSGRSRLRPFAHFLSGIQHTWNQDRVVLSDTLELLRENPGNLLTLAFGGGVDVRVNERIAIRVVQYDHFRVFSGGQNQGTHRLSAGMVLLLRRQ